MTVRTAARILLLPVLVLSACSVYKVEKELKPEDADFLARVRYLITQEERRDFLALPDAEKPAFVEAFWKRRDPDPVTEENELRMEYETRLDAAAKLFAGEGQPGYLTDRGRIYVLYGPPSERQTQSNLNRAETRCSEVWYYANFPVVFIDSSCTGRYRLSTFDLSPIRELDISEMAPASKPGQLGAGLLLGANRRFDYEMDLTVVERGPQRLTARLRLRLPYGSVWYTSEAKTLRTTFAVAVEIRTAAKELVYESKASFPVSLTEAELPARAKQDFVMDMPIDILDASRLALLGKGKDQLVVTVVNQTGGESQKKSVDFR